MYLHITKSIIHICSLRIFFQATSKDLDFRNTKLVLGHNLAWQRNSLLRVLSQPPLNFHNPFYPSHLLCLRSEGNSKSPSQRHDLYSQYELPHFQKSQEHIPIAELSYLYQWPSPHSELEQLHNIYNGMESNMTHVSKRKLERDMYPMLLPARKALLESIS